VLGIEKNYQSNKSIMGKFEELVKKEPILLVDFFAEWCGPCKMMAPVLEQVKAAVGEKAKIVKIDVDKNPSISQQMQIRSIPTMVLYKDGKQVWRHSGVASKAQLEQLIQEHSS
jgi:thioredoxin 1